MIAQRAIESFLASPGDSYEWIKDAPRADLIRELQEYPYHTDFKTDPRLCQLACYLLGISLPTFCFFLDMRLGKTKLMLDVFSYYRAETKSLAPHRPFRGLILVPQLLHMEPWREQVPIHAPHLSVQLLEGSSGDRLESLDQGGADLYVLNYQGLVHLLSSKENQRPARQSWEKKKQDRRTLHPDFHKIAWVGERFSYLVLDESTTVKNRTSLTFEICDGLSQIIPYRYALTGTPFGRSPEDLWAQFYLIDRGETLGKTITFFREAYFTKKKRYWGGYDYIFKEALTDTLHRRIQNRSIRYLLEECEDLPQKIYDPIRLTWDPEAFGYYERELSAFRNEAISAIQRENHFMAMRQLTAGFCRIKNEDGDEEIITFSQNPKLDALIELLQGLDLNRKMVVFHFFIPSGDLLHARLKKEKIGAVRIWSETKNRPTLLNQFRTDDKTRVLIVNERIGSMALDLQCANYITFYDLPVSPITRAQAEARCRGPQQRSPSIIHDLMYKGSVDEKIHAFIKAGHDLHQAIMDGTESL